MKLLFNGVECTFAQWLSAILASAASDEAATLNIVGALIEAREEARDNEMRAEDFRISPSLATIIEGMTSGQCKVVLNG